VNNPIPRVVARVIAGEVTASTLGRPGDLDVFVTAAEDIAGLNAEQLAQRLAIPRSNTFTIIEFATPAHGLASPVHRERPGFVGRGLTRLGAREFIISNREVPSHALSRVVR
jgi:hypothetical protein